MVLSAQSAGQQRLSFLQRAVAAGDTPGELARLRDENRRLRSENRTLKARFGGAPGRKHYTPMQRLQILWHMTYYGIPPKQGDGALPDRPLHLLSVVARGRTR
jgi:hypothetical protein